ncbi:uncharacterized protein At5g19025-like [Phoenix dactylifera]|uniref:Uncharacterized protein At5g19025-like n=1 Tax=Phoenix dactylifera TaxID=42345 RepID=A0A8B7CWV7_PHODC|nr:uncharacterized protein At5g19025-like [Phoenix dactylifera]
MIRRFSPLTAMPSSSSSSSSSSPSPRPKRNPNPNTNFSNPKSGSLPPCKHSPAATLDLLILVLVLFSCAFLIISSLAHLVRALSTLLPPLLRPLAASFHAAPLPYLAAIVLLLLIATAVAAAELSGAAWPWDWPCWRRRRCGKPRCRGLRKALEFDVQLQTEDGLRSPPDAAAAAMWKEIDGLPWKGGQQGNNPDYECLRAELRRMAPPNGRAVLLFRSQCGCPVAKLEGWGPKRSRRQKKGMANLALERGR